MDLNYELKEIALRNGISCFGIADLSQAQDYICQQGGEEVTDYPYSISLGITLPHTIVDRLPDKNKRSVALNYRHHAYDIINLRLDLTASLLSSIIQNYGYKALPIPASERVDDERICASFSHKLGARLAGLGWIGKSCLLVTPENGPRVRWTSILTNAPLKPAVNIIEEKCGDCTECVDICPKGAFTGRSFRDDEPRELRYNAKECENYFKDMKNNGKIAVCGLCLYVCPFGRNIKQAQT